MCCRTWIPAGWQTLQVGGQMHLWVALWTCTSMWAQVHPTPRRTGLPCWASLVDMVSSSTTISGIPRTSSPILPSIAPRSTPPPFPHLPLHAMHRFTHLCLLFASQHAPQSKWVPMPCVCALTVWRSQLHTQNASFSSSSSTISGGDSHTCLSCLHDNAPVIKRDSVRPVRYGVT